MDTTAASTASLSASAGSSIVSYAAISPTAPGPSSTSSIDPALHERLQRDFKRLKAKVQSLERENEALKGSLFELSVRYGAALSKGKAREVEEDKTKQTISWGRDSVTASAAETPANVLSNEHNFPSNVNDDRMSASVVSSRDSETTLAPSIDEGISVSPASRSPASAPLPALDPSAAAALLPALPPEMSGLETEHLSKSPVKGRDWDTLAGVEDTEDAKELARLREKERGKVLAQGKMGGWKFTRGYDLKVRSKLQDVTARRTSLTVVAIERVIKGQFMP
jgi:hypothetical protein